MTTIEYINEILAVMQEFIQFISSPAIQDALFPVKIVFIIFFAFFFCAVIYFYINSSYLQNQFLQDTSEFFSRQAYGLNQISRRLKKITKKIEFGTEQEYKIAIIQADDFLFEALESRVSEGETFEELVKNAAKTILSNKEDVLHAHQVRNTIVYDVNYTLDLEEAKKILIDYEKAIKMISTS